MYKKILFSLAIVIVLSFSFVVLAKENNQADEGQQEGIINTINNEAGPVFQSIANSFRVDVWDKTAVWIEKTKSVKDNNSTFFDVIHKFFTGKEGAKN